MRSLLPLLLAAAALPAADPLALAGEEQSAAAHALVRLGAGDAAPFAALPPALLAAAAAVADPGQPGLSRRWTQAIPAALARVPAGERDRLLAALDAAFASRADRDSARTAADFLPAAAAVRSLRRAADEAWDAGRLADHLALLDLLGGEGGARAEAAMRLLGAAADPLRQAGHPGLPEPTGEAPAARPPGLRVRWAVRPGWLLACDPWDRVRWQLAVATDALVLPGDGGCLVRDAGGWRVVGEDGRVRDLPPMPGRIRGLGVAAGACWFALGSQVWRIGLDGDPAPHRELLASPPLAAPQAVAGAVLLVDAVDQVLIAPGRPALRTRHGLPVEEDWRLAAGRGAPLLLAPDGRRWRLPALAAQLDGADAAGRLRLAVAAGRPELAAALLAERPELAGEPSLAPLVLRARLMARPAAVDGLEPLAAPADRALLAWYAWGRSAEARWRAALLAAELPAAGLPADPALAGWPESHWDHRVGPAGLPRLLDPRPAPPVPPAAAATAPFAAPRPCAPDASLFTSGRSQGRTRLHMTVAGTLAWSRSWPVPPLLQAPAMAAVRRGDLLLVVEGHEAWALDAATGLLLRRATLDCEPVPDLLRLVGLPPGPRTLPAADSGTRLLMLAPPGILDRLVDEDGRFEMLPAPARWCEALPGGGLVMADRQGRGWLRSADGPWTPCPLPDRLALALPEPRTQGLEAEGSLYAWSWVNP